MHFFIRKKKEILIKKKLIEKLEARTKFKGINVGISSEDSFVYFCWQLKALKRICDTLKHEHPSEYLKKSLSPSV